jgi:hypothetical protein
MTNTLISRKQANELIDLLMDTEGPKQMRRKAGRPGPKSRRFGRCELDELLDAIYGREELYGTDDDRARQEVPRQITKLAS